MPPPFAFFNDQPHHDSPPTAVSAEPTAVKATDQERQDNKLIDAIEKRAIAELRAALREIELAVWDAADKLGGESETVIVANVMKVVEDNNDVLQLAIYRTLVATSQAGVVNVSQALPFNMSIGVDWSMSNANAEAFARTYSYDLISRVTQTTRKGVSQAVARWIKEGGTLPELADSIRPLLVNEPSTRIIENLFNVDRATMIAETEATRAYARGKVIGYTSSGLAQQGPNKEAPAHVRCRCDVRPDSDPDGSWWWIWLTANDDAVCDICGPLHKTRVGLARPAPLPDDAKAIAIQHRPIRYIEQSFASKSKQNMAVYVNGRLQFTANGTARRVQVKGITPKGSTIVFNQPGGVGFSVADVTTAHTHQVAELRMVGINSEGRAWRFIIKPNASFFSLTAKKLAGHVEQAQRSVTADMVMDVAGGVMLREQAVNEYWHQVWREVDARLSKNGRARLGYKRENLYG